MKNITFHSNLDALGKDQHSNLEEITFSLEHIKESEQRFTHSSKLVSGWWIAPFSLLGSVFWVLILRLLWS